MGGYIPLLPLLMAFTRKTLPFNYALIQTLICQVRWLIRYLSTNMIVIGLVRWICELFIRFNYCFFALFSLTTLLFLYFLISQYISLRHSEITSSFRLPFFVTLLYVSYVSEIRTRFHFSLGTRTDVLLGSAVYRVLSFNLARSICFVLGFSIAFQPVSHSDAFESLSALASGNTFLQKYMCCFCHMKF